MVNGLHLDPIWYLSLINGFFGDNASSANASIYRPPQRTRYRGPYLCPYHMVIWYIRGDWVTVKFSVGHTWPSALIDRFYLLVITNLRQQSSPSVLSVSVLIHERLSVKSSVNYSDLPITCNSYIIIVSVFFL